MSGDGAAKAQPSLTPGGAQVAAAADTSGTGKARPQALAPGEAVTTGVRQLPAAPVAKAGPTTEPPPR